jgi:hypothetical protein
MLRDADRRGHVPAQPRVLLIWRNNNRVDAIPLTVLAEVFDPAHLPWQLQTGDGVERERHRVTLADLDHVQLGQIGGFDLLPAYSDMSRKRR